MEISFEKGKFVYCPGGFNYQEVLDDFKRAKKVRIAAALLAPPFAVWLNGPDGAENMKVRVRNTAVLLVRLVDGKVGNHAPAHKLLRNKLPCKSDVFLQ